MLVDVVGGVLTALSVDDETIKAIVSILQQSQDALAEGTPGTLNAAYLGGSDAARELGFHTSLAHAHVVRAMEDMVAGLGGYVANVEKFHQDVTFADDTSATSASTGAARVESTSVPSLEDATACATATPQQADACPVLPAAGA